MPIPLLQPLGLMQIPLNLSHFAPELHNRVDLLLHQTIQIIQILLDIAADLVRLVPQPHVFLGQLDRLVYVSFMLTDQLLLLFED